MDVLDADGHVEEWSATFGDEYLDPEFHHARPVVIAGEKRAYWMIQDRVFPQLVGPGCHILGTPTGYGTMKPDITTVKPETVDSLELRDTAARIADMTREGLDLQVLYPTLFVAYPLTHDVALYGALCRSYNSWIADATKPAADQLKWVGVVSLADPAEAAREVVRMKSLGAVAVVILGTDGTNTLDDLRYEPFWAQCEQSRMPVAVHVGWSCPPLNQMYDHVYQAAIVPFVMPVQMAFMAIISGGVLDRHPNLKVGFFEAGASWIPYFTDLMDHQWHTAQKLPWMGYKAERRPSEYLRGGNVYFTFETEEVLLPQVLDMVGENQFMYASDMPHADREEFNSRELKERGDLSEAVKKKLLVTNAQTFYDL